MTKLRLSFTLLTLWNNGRWTDAVKMYRHEPTEKSQAMIEGLAMHEKWEREINKSKRLKLKGHSFNFTNPQCERKMVVGYNDRWDLSGTFDVLDGGTIYEFKSGKMNSLEYVNGYQLPFYFLIAKRANIPVEKAILVHYNQHIDKYDTSMLWNSTKQIEKAENFIDSLAPEIETYFVKNHISFEKGDEEV